MHDLARAPDEERRDLFEEAALRMGMPSPVVVEKDFWVVWALDRLFTAETLPRLLFKGGTSLSKGYGLIHRFSEDIDLGIERADLGLPPDADPRGQKSRKGYQKALRRLLPCVQDHVREVFLPTLRAHASEALGRQARITHEIHGTENVLLFAYPRSLGPRAYGPTDYIAPVVRLELGARADHYPTEHVVVRSYAAQQVPEAFSDGGCRVRVQAPVRTLLEKALILHSANCRGSLPAHASRHAYDVVMMHRSGITSAVRADLIREVAEHKLMFADDRPASLAPEEGFRLVPTGEVLADLRRDYEAMAPMFFPRPEPPSVEEVLLGLTEVQADLEALRQA